MKANSVPMLAEKIWIKKSGESNRRRLERILRQMLKNQPCSQDMTPVGASR